MASSARLAASPAVLPGTAAFVIPSGLKHVDLATAFNGEESPRPAPSIAFTPSCFNPKAENERSQQLMTTYCTVPSSAALSKDPPLLSDQTLSSLVYGGKNPPPLSAGTPEKSSTSCCSSLSSETIGAHGRAASECESKPDINRNVQVMQAQENTNKAHQVELADTAVDPRPVTAGHGSSGLTTLNAFVIGGLSMQPLLAPQRQQMAQARSWDQILDMLYIIPADASLAIRQTIIEALGAIEAKGGAVLPVVAKCLQFAVSVQDSSRMRLIGLRTLEKCRPKQEDPLDKLCSFLATQQQQQPSSVMPLVAPLPIPIINHPATRTTRPPIGLGVSGIRGDANFRKAVARKSSMPWHELIEEIRTMKPNNGYPVKVNITAAIKSATMHRVNHSAEVARRLAYSLSLYYRKSCGATKQEALKVLELAAL